MEKRKKIALVAHDNMKDELVDWVESDWDILIDQELICTGTTGKLVEAAFNRKTKENGSNKKPSIVKLKSGPLGGDQQLGALIAERKVDIIIFFWDPMQPQPHDVDVKALLRIAVLYNVVSACDRSTADFIITSKYFLEPYDCKVSDFLDYTERKL